MKKFKILFAVLLLPVLMFGQNITDVMNNYDSAAALFKSDKFDEGHQMLKRGVDNYFKVIKVTKLSIDLQSPQMQLLMEAQSKGDSARAAGSACILRQIQNAKAQTESFEEEAKALKELAEKLAKEGKCAEAIKAANIAEEKAQAARASLETAKKLNNWYSNEMDTNNRQDFLSDYAAKERKAANAKDIDEDVLVEAGFGAYYNPYAVDEKPNKSAEPYKACKTASENTTQAAEKARKAADGCKDKAQTDPAPPAPARIIMAPTLGGGVGLAQSSADIGYCRHKDGTLKAFNTATASPGMNLGFMLYKEDKIKKGLTDINSLNHPHNPYASFASYRTSASGNAGPAPVTTAEGGKLDLMSLNLGMSFLHLKGKDRYPERGASFDKKMVEVLATGDFYFINLLRAKRATRSPKVSPFVRLGAGFGIGNPNTVNGDKGDKKVNFALPMGLGFRVNVSSLVSLNIDYTTRATFSDALDGVTSSTKNNDWYGAGGVGLSFMLGKKANDSDGDGVKNNDDRCPTIPGTLYGCPDTDGDSIADRDDTCPNEAGEIRMNGCPDTDGDGIPDNKDDCPNDAGLRRFAGCPDTDSDNIIDKEDRCPTVAGLAAMNGCPDSDRDGVTDDKDDCPKNPGPAEQNGCPDTDNDGIADKLDDCPDVPGLGKFKGCPDTDNDGIADNKDKCPNLKGPASNEGCPEIDAADKVVLDGAMRNVKFRPNSAELLPSSRKYLDQIAEIMSRYKGYKLSIDGYTDNSGPAAANQSLSEARAKACYDYLASTSVRLSLMTYTGHGPTNPIGDNNTEEGRLKNRRVEFRLIPQ